MMLSQMALAGTKSDYDRFKNQTQQYNHQAENAAKNFKPEQVFKGYSANPTQKQYYQGVEVSKDNLPDIAGSELEKDEAGAAIYKHFADKPMIEINKSADAIKQAEFIQRQSHAIVNGQSNNEIHCEQKPKKCIEVMEDEQCIYAKDEISGHFIGCSSQKDRGCRQSQSVCIKKQDDACISFQQTYLCPKNHCEMAVVCAKDVFCADGSCVNTKESTNQNLGQDVSALSAVSASANEFVVAKQEEQSGKNIPFPSRNKKKEIRIFKGKAVQCKIEPFGFLDCCSDKGWGEKLNLATCPDEDKALGVAKLAYKAHFLGRYCAKKWPKPIKGCKVWKNTYCVFDSKLSRIIHEEGRLKQINSSALGTAQYPQCNGLTIDELRHIDMGRVDFIAPVYPYGNGTHDRKAGIADDMSINAPASEKMLSATSERIKKRMEQKQ